MTSTAVYMRVSLDIQQCDAQEHSLIEWLEGRPDIQSPLWFMETISGAAKNRPEFERMMAMVDDGVVTRVVCYSKDRLGRDLADRLMTIGRIHGSGCELVSITEGTSGSSIEDILIESIRAYVAASERRSIRQRTSAGIRARIASGQRWGGSMHNPSAIRGRRKLTDAQERAAAERVRAGESIAAVAASMGVPRSTLGGVVRRVCVDMKTST